MPSMFPKSSVPRTLLEYFREHSGRVLTRDELALHVWNFRLDHRSRVIDQTVNMVRKQLGLPERIVTVHRQGYRHQRDERATSKGKFTAVLGIPPAPDPQNAVRVPIVAD